jgi:hypothetical protein
LKLAALHALPAGSVYFAVSFQIFFAWLDSHGAKRFDYCRMLRRTEIQDGVIKIKEKKFYHQQITLSR